MPRLDSTPPADPLAKLNQVDMACDKFEECWRSGRPVTLTQFVQEHHLECTSSLLKELLLIEVDYRRRRGESISAEDYTTAFAEHVDTIAEVMRLSTLGNHHAPGPDQARGSLATPQLPQRYHLEQEVGSGSFGRVYRAHDAVLDRVVAIKMLHPWLVASRGATERFLREARNAAQLHHPGIVPVFEAEQHASGSFIVAEFAAGPTLAQELVRRRFDSRESAALVAQVADALEYAHRRSVVHRDLKPSNVVLQPVDREHDAEDGKGQLESYRPRVLDFGLARRGDSQETLTLSGEILGTPAYMSPEQAQGEGHAADCRTDVYSLGAVLYHLLTGQPPFRGPMHEVIRRVATEDVPSVRRTNPAVPVDLAAICDKCLQSDPQSRYVSARALADDLRRWLSGQTIEARPISPGQRLWRKCRRHPLRVAVAAAMLGLVLAAAAIFTWQSMRLEDSNLRLARQNVESLLRAPVNGLASALRSVRELPPESLPILVNAYRDESLAPSERLRLRLALLPHDPSHADELFRDMLVADVGEFLVIREELLPYAPQYLNELRGIVESPSAETKPGSWLRAACALARFRPDAEALAAVAPQLAEQLASQPSEDVAGWIQAAAPARPLLHAPLMELLHERDPSPASGRIACQLLASFLSDQPAELASLLLETGLEQHTIVMQALLPHKKRGAEQLAAHAARLQRAVAGGDQDERAARMRATAAIGLLTLDQHDGTWPKLRDNPDPRLRSYFIHTAAPRGLPPHVLIERLATETDPGVLYSIMLALGTYAPGELSPSQRQSLIPWLQDSYRTHADSGVHAAAGWLLKRWGEADFVTACDTELIEQGIVAGRNWYVNTLGQTMIILVLSDSISVGDDKHQVTRRIAIAATETTCGHMRRFRPEFEVDRAICPDDSYPAVFASLHDAAAFCRWLSERELSGTDQLAVVQSSVEVAPDKMETTTRIDPAASGYRPLLAEEWELACGAGSRLERFFGSNETPFLDAYCNAQGVLHAAATHMPNRLGFFDVYGNVHEWTASLFSASATSGPDAKITIGHGTTVIHRGGANNSPKHSIGTSQKSPYVAFSTRHNVGFRIARTLPEAAP